MPKYFHIGLLGFAFCANVAMADSTVKCSLKTDDKTEWVQLKLNAKSEIVQWDTKKWGKVSKNAYWLSVFAEDIEEYGFEWQKSFKARNGYSILELGTTADAFLVGVNQAAGKGFFTYKDYGSGAGNTGPLDLSCEAL